LYKYFQIASHYKIYGRERYKNNSRQESVRYILNQYQLQNMEPYEDKRNQNSSTGYEFEEVPGRRIREK
jgi:hypothetical protein